MNKTRLRQREAGAALLALMLIIVVAASTYLVLKLNDNVTKFVREDVTTGVLGEAKIALLSYALRYPEDHPGEGPGYLPCPDISNDGFAGGACAMSGTNNTTIGRLPWKTLEITELRDHAGERLWYAVSENFKNNPKELASLNSDSPGTLRVDANNDIVAVIFAPAGPVTNQDRGGDPYYVGNYLEGENADDDIDFVTRAPGEFNDLVVPITRRELMAVIEKRVMGEVRQALLDYQATYGRYPWLTAFADPKASFLNLKGDHSGIDNSADLTDSFVEVNFNDWGVQPGDIVFNTTDGSVGTVSSVTATTLTLSNLVFGTDNDFDTDDEYTVVSFSNAGLLSGTATVGSNNLVLNDTAMDFEEIGVSPGDIVDNGTDGSSGTIDSVSQTRITVSALTGGTNNAFSTGDNYRIRSNRGMHTGADNSASLTADDMDFTVMGIQQGDLVVNLTDSSMGRVDTVAVNTLTLDGLYFGTDNDFDAGDLFYIPRYGTDNASREGLLSFHETGKHFRTGFAVDWTASSANGAVLSTSISADNPHPDYLADLENKVQTSNGTSGTVNVEADDGQCVWVREGIAECAGIYMDPAFPVQGTVTSGVDSSQLTDANADFNYTAVKQGDLVLNFDDESYAGISGTTTGESDGAILEDTTKNFNTLGIIPNYHFIHNHADSDARGLITEIIDDNTLRIMEFTGRPAMDMDPNESYSIYTPQRVVVTGVTSSTQLQTAYLTSAAPDFDFNAGQGSGGGYEEFYEIYPATGRLPRRFVDIYVWPGNVLRDAGADFSEIQPGDIVHNIDDNAYGIITAVDAANDELTAQLYAADGSTRSFNDGEDYRVYYNHFSLKRRYEFQTGFSGSSNVYAAGNVRKRDVCLGYTADCGTISGNTALPEKNSFIVIKDLDINGNVVASSAIDIPSSGAQGTVRIAGMDYYLSEIDSELPSWFLKNKWHQYVYVASSNDLAPDGDGACTAGTDCLTIGGSLNMDDAESIVLMAGTQLADMSCGLDPSQDRTKARLCDYLEDENADSGDDSFWKPAVNENFNDGLLVVSPPLY